MLYNGSLTVTIYDENGTEKSTVTVDNKNKKDNLINKGWSMYPGGTIKMYYSNSYDMKWNGGSSSKNKHTIIINVPSNASGSGSISATSGHDDHDGLWIHYTGSGALSSASASMS